jgi:hypothetical protein
VFYKLTGEYSNIISDYSVSDFRRYGSASSLVAKIEFIDGSILYIKDYLFTGILRTALRLKNKEELLCLIKAATFSR